MKIAALIQRLQKIQTEHGDVDVVVGLDEREIDEREIVEVSYAEAYEECPDQIPRRVVLMAPGR